MDYLNNMSIKQKLQLRTLELEINSMETLLSAKSTKNVKYQTEADSYVSEYREKGIYASYTRTGLLQQNNTSDEEQKIWDSLANISGVGRLNGEFIIDGKIYQRSDINKMPSEMLTDLKAEKNTLVIKSGVYYGIETQDGGTSTKWGMNVSSLGGLRISGSETMYAVGQGIALEELGEWSKFFRSVTKSGDSAAAGIYISDFGLSQEKVKKMMDTLGFEPGMCTINIDGRENKFYYSNNGKIYPKYHYDGIYKGLTDSDNSEDYEVGDEFNYNGHTYTMDENGHINVPYGEDLFNCLSRPKGKMAG